MKKILFLLQVFFLFTIESCEPPECVNGSPEGDECNCIGGWEGPRCDTCKLECNHGTPDYHCEECECESGYFGAHCDSLYRAICGEIFGGNGHDYLVTSQYNSVTTTYYCWCHYVNDSTIQVDGFDGFSSEDEQIVVDLANCTIKDQTFENAHGSYQLLSSGSMINGSMNPQIIICYLKDNQDITIAQFSRQ